MSNKSLKPIAPFWSILLYGAPKIGISALSSSDTGKKLYLSLKDDGRNVDADYKISVNSWEDFLKIGAEISAGKYSVKTIIVAHTEDLWDYLCRYITEQSNLKNGTTAENISDLSYSEWRQALHLFEEKLRKLLSFGNIILLSQELVEVRNVRGLERTFFLANIERKAQLMVLNIVDAIGRIYTCEQDIRVLSFLPTENQVTGSRIPALLEKKYIIQNEVRPKFFDQLDEAMVAPTVRRAS